MTTFELVSYYIQLLILQYVGKEKAEATIRTQVSPIIMPQESVQVITFSAVPTSGLFTLSYEDTLVAVQQWNENAANLQTELRVTFPDLLVTGNFTDGFTVNFVNVAAPASPLVASGNTLLASAVAVTITVTETDVILPLAVQDGFNLTGDNLAVGVQLDTIGDYAGVSRTGSGFTGQIVLDDTDYLSLIRMAIIQNSSGSSLAEIQAFIQQFFAGDMLVFDYQNMQMSYLISTDIGSPELVQLFVTNGLLPRPMAVQVALVIYAPIIDMFFGFRTYELAAFNASPFNTYDDYQTDWPWLSYSNAVSS